MSYYAWHYHDGQEIRVGDVVLEGDVQCQVAVVLHLAQAIRGWGKWLRTLPEMYGAEGFMLDHPSGPVFFEQSDEDLVLVHRRAPDDMAQK